MKLNRLILAAASMTQAGTMAAQTVNWVEMGSPSARCCMSLAYDGATHPLVLFGGAIPSQLYGDTWIWRGGWLRLSPAASPSARSGAGMAYDGTAGNVVLFGGASSTGTNSQRHLDLGRIHLDSTISGSISTGTQPNGFGLRRGDENRCPVWRLQCRLRCLRPQRHLDMGRRSQDLDPT